MKKTTVLLLCLLAALTGCKKQEQKFSYNVDKFYDLEVLRYQVPDFESLTVQQKALLYYLSEAALYGRDILYDQNCRYNLRIRRPGIEELDPYRDRSNPSAVSYGNPRLDAEKTHNLALV